MLARTRCTWLRSLQMLAMALVVGLLVGLLGRIYHYHFVFVPEGMTLFGQDVAGLSRFELQEFLTESWQERRKQSFDVVVSGHGGEPVRKPASLQDLGVSFRLAETANRLLAGKDSQAFKADLIQARDALGDASAEIEPLLNLDGAVVAQLEQFLVGYEKARRDAQLYLDEDEGQWILLPHESGFGLSDAERKRLLVQLQAMAAGENPDADVEVVFERLEPEVLAPDLQPVYDRLQQVLDKEVVWMVDGREVLFQLRDYPWMVDVDVDADPDEQVEILPEVLQVFVEEWAEMFDRSAGMVAVSDPLRQQNGSLKSSYQGSFRAGRALDQEQMRERLMLALMNEEQQVEIELPEQLLSADVVFGDQSLELLAQGRSSYRLGNGPDRVYNVEFGLNKYDGIVIPQGEEFSFNQILGYVRYEDGWKPALAIFGGGGVRKVPGGGLCQVSTTVYRAAILSGLPITQRKPHSLDVSYYHAYGDGIDATIYPPTDLDLKFVNDTPGPIVVHSYVDPVAEEAFVEFYGVPDGRSVELVQTINRPVKLPAETIVSDELAPGERQVIFGGRLGRYVEWDWKVTDANGRVDHRYIETLYPAAPPKVAVGTGG